MKTASYFFLVFMCLFVSSKTLSDAVQNESVDSEYWSIQLENDVFTSEAADRFYTNGIQFNYIKKGTPKLFLDTMLNRLPFFIRSDTEGVGYSFGQKMFTPNDKEIAELIEDDRPYAGWLYSDTSITSIIRDEPAVRDLNSIKFTVGIIGPSSRAGSVQNEIHKLIGVDESQGWDNQLKDELGLVATYVRKREHFYQFKNGWEYSTSPHRVFALGNVYTYLGAGLMFRLGQNLHNDIGPPNINPGFPGAAYFRSTQKKNSWYLFGGVEARAVVRNIFLDGNTFKDSHTVDKKTLVQDLQYGIAYQRNNKRFSYSHIFRSKEFKSQKENANFGSLNYSFYFD